MFKRSGGILRISRRSVNNELSAWNWELTEYCILQLEKATKKRRGSRHSLSTANSNSVEPWLERTLEILSSLNTASPPSRKTPVPAPTSMTLRERKTKSKSGSPASSPSPRRTRIASGAVKDRDEKFGQVSDATSPPMSASSSFGSSDSQSADAEVTKKLPRVILRLGPHPSTVSGA
jgi:histone deacetylase HOS3